MITINAIDGFQEAQVVSPSEKLASARINKCSFFISGCVTCLIGNKSGFVGKIMSNLSESEVCGLKSNEEVFFIPTH